MDFLKLLTFKKHFLQKCIVYDIFKIIWNLMLPSEGMDGMDDL